MQGNRTVVGVDIAKRVFQLHWVEAETGELVGRRLTRAKFLDHFANRAPCLVGMEACGGAQHWARRLLALGHKVRLLPAKMVRPFVSGNKDDAHDARAIWTAVQQPGVKTVAVKSEEQQGILALHRMRQQLVKFRTATDQLPARTAGRVRRSDASRQSRNAAGHSLGPRAGLAAVAGNGRRDPARAMGSGDRPRRRDRPDRAASRSLAPPESRQPADRSDPGCRGAERDRRGRHDGRSGSVPIRTGNSRPGWVSYLDTRARVDGYACSGSRSVGRPIFERC